MCINITRDVMRLIQQGQGHDTILAYIESEYKPLASTDGQTFSCGGNSDGGCGVSAGTQSTGFNLESLPQVDVPANKTATDNTTQATDFAQAKDFIKALADTINQQALLPDFAELVVAPLYLNERTFSFNAKDTTVLQLNIFGYPDPKSTETLVPPLIEVSKNLATQYNIPLTGLEIIFHRRHTINPMLIFAATPPWGTEQTTITPLSAELEQLSAEILKITAP